MQGVRALPPRPRRTTVARRSPWIALVAVVAVVVSACTGGDDSPAPSTSIDGTTTTTVERNDDGTLVLGVYLPVTGEGSELGQPMIEAVENAVLRINEAGGVLGHDVVVEQLDEGAGTGPGALMEAGVDAIVGPASSLTALSHLASLVDPVTGVVVCSPSATALALDDFPDNTFFFRTAPSDSLQMTAIARQAQRTGARSVAVGYLDDPYGRGLYDAFLDDAQQLGIAVLASVPFSGGDTDLSSAANDLLAVAPGVIIVLGNSDDGGRLLAALDAADASAPEVIVNDAIRQARQTIQSLSPEFRDRLTGIAPKARAVDPNGPEGFFAAHAADCVNLIALSVLAAGSDAPRAIRTAMASTSADGRSCRTFEACALLLAQVLNIDYDGASGSVELANTTGDPMRARFVAFGFDAEGAEIDVDEFDVP